MAGLTHEQYPAYLNRENRRQKWRRQIASPATRTFARINNASPEVFALGAAVLACALFVGTVAVTEQIIKSKDYATQQPDAIAPAPSSILPQPKESKGSKPEDTQRDPAKAAHGLPPSSSATYPTGEEAISVPWSRPNSTPNAPTHSEGASPLPTVSDNPAIQSPTPEQSTTSPTTESSESSASESPNAEASLPNVTVSENGLLSPSALPLFILAIR